MDNTTIKPNFPSWKEMEKVVYNALCATDHSSDPYLWKQLQGMHGRITNALWLECALKRKHLIPLALERLPEAEAISAKDRTCSWGEVQTPFELALGWVYEEEREFECESRAAAHFERMAYGSPDYD